MNRGRNGTMGRIRVEFTCANYGDEEMVRRGTLPLDQVRRVQLRGVVDSGATYLVLPEAAVRQLGLPPAGQATVHFADRRSATRDVVQGASVTLLGRQGTFKAIVEPNRTDALIGAIVLEDLDLLVDCNTQTLQPRDPNRITAEIE